MAKFNFEYGVRYSRNGALKAMGMDPVPRWGPYVNGYFEYKGAHFVFCNVGVPGRTGHDYPNRFEGDELLWTGKTGAKREHASIQRLTSPEGEVHVFYREDNRDDFTYVGMARAVAVDDACPVGVRWRFVAADDFDDARGIDAAASARNWEGASRTTEGIRYERSPAARALCIAHFGSACQVCGIEFGKKYGKRGEGYIHVHHHVPISMVSGPYVVDPIKDLVPVCPNCHAMLHRGGKTLSIDELRAIIAASALM